MEALDQSPKTAPYQEPLEIAVDAEHNGIRAAGCGTFAGSTLLFIFLLNLFIPTAVVVGVGAVILAAIVANLLDRYLKGRWPSGRVLHADAATIELQNRADVESRIDPSKQVNVLTWRFEVPRSGRVKKGWYVLGLALEQDSTYLPVYTFASPKDFEEMPYADAFHRLERRRKRKAKTESIREMKAAGAQRRLYEAEIERGLYGAEVTLDEFIILMEYLQTHYPKWMIEP